MILRIRVLAILIARSFFLGSRVCLWNCESWPSTLLSFSLLSLSRWSVLFRCMMFLFLVGFYSLCYFVLCCCLMESWFYFSLLNLLGVDVSYMLFMRCRVCVVCCLFCLSDMSASSAPRSSGWDTAFVLLDPR